MATSPDELVALRERLARAESENAELRRLVESSSVGVAVLHGHELICTYANQALARLTEGRFGVGSSGRAVLTSPGAPPFLALLEGVLTTGEEAASLARVLLVGGIIACVVGLKLLH